MDFIFGHSQTAGWPKGFTVKIPIHFSAPIMISRQISELDVPIYFCNGLASNDHSLHYQFAGRSRQKSQNENSKT